MKQLKWGREYAILLAAVLVLVLVLPVVMRLVRVPTFETFGNFNEKALPNSSAAASQDPDLKCPGQAAAGSTPTCAPSDIIRLGYDISIDPRLSVLELKTIQEVYKSRGSDVENLFTKFMINIMMLRAATMYNTDSNEAKIEKILDDMKNNKSDSDCFTDDFMATAKGLLVGSKEQKTLSIAQSEAVRCYAHRFNGIMACLNGGCK